MLTPSATPYHHITKSPVKVVSYDKKFFKTDCFWETVKKEAFLER